MKQWGLEICKGILWEKCVGPNTWNFVAFGDIKRFIWSSLQLKSVTMSRTLEFWKIKFKKKLQLVLDELERSSILPLATERSWEGHAACSYVFMYINTIANRGVLAAQLVCLKIEHKLRVSGSWPSHRLGDIIAGNVEWRQGFISSSARLATEHCFWGWSKASCD